MYQNESFCESLHTTNQNKCTTRQLSSADESDSEKTSGRITVRKLDSKSKSVKIKSNHSKTRLLVHNYLNWLQIQVFLKLF